MSNRLIKPSQVRARGTPTRENNVPTSAQLRAIAKFWELEQKLGREPTLRELSAALKMSTNGAQSLMSQLTDKRLLCDRKELKVVGKSITDLGHHWIKLLEKGEI